MHLFPWLGDKALNTVTALLRSAGLKTNSFNGIIDVQETDIHACKKTIEKLLLSPCPATVDLASTVPNTFTEKHDRILPKELRDLNYGAKFFDIDGAWNWMKTVI